MTTNATVAKVSRFADLRQLYAEETASDAFAAAFTETVDTAQLSPFDEPTSAEMPDAFAAELAAEMLTRTPFELFSGSRLEPFAESLAYGIVNALQYLTQTLERRADDAARKVKELCEDPDGSEIQTAELEEAITFAQSLDEAQDAIACMRDHAARTFAAETGRAWHGGRGSVVSSKMTAAVVMGQDFQRARRQRRQDMHAPQGPVVLFSGPKDWDDHGHIYEALNAIRARIPHMVLVTTGQAKGADAIAQAWAARNKVTVVAFVPNRGGGSSAGFNRNKQMLALKPVEAVLCQGSGIQSHLNDALKSAGVPRHLFRRPAAQHQPQRRAG